MSVEEVYLRRSQVQLSTGSQRQCAEFLRAISA